MELLPESLINKIHKHQHEILYSKVMKLLKAYRISTIFIVSLELLEFGYYEFGGVRTSCVDINNVNATSHETLCLINNNRYIIYDRWSRR